MHPIPLFLRKPLMEWFLLPLYMLKNLEKIGVIFHLLMCNLHFSFYNVLKAFLLDTLYTYHIFLDRSIVFTIWITII